MTSSAQPVHASAHHGAWPMTSSTQPVHASAHHGALFPTDVSSAGLASLADRCNDNLMAIVEAQVGALKVRVSPVRAVRLLSAFAQLCGNGKAVQDAVAHREDAIRSIVEWLTTPNKLVQATAAQAVLALVSNNKGPQTIVGNGGAIPALVKLLEIKYA